MSAKDEMSNPLADAAAMAVTVTPREWPICASYRDDSSSRCQMENKFLNINCYSPNDPYLPQHPCSWCQQPLHSRRCSFVEQGKEVCLTCMEQTRHVEDPTAQSTTTTKRASTSTSATSTALALKRRKIAVTQAAVARTARATTTTMTTDVQDQDAYWVVFPFTKLGLELSCCGEGERRVVVVSKVSNEECKDVI